MSAPPSPSSVIGTARSLSLITLNTSLLLPPVTVVGPTIWLPAVDMSIVIVLAVAALPSMAIDEPLTLP